MAKVSKKQVETDEQKVVMILQSHAKESIDKLAKKCGFSGPKLRRIIKNLEHSKKIWGYHAVTDFNEIGLKEYFLLIKKYNKPMKETAEKIISGEFEKKATELNTIISSSYYIHGTFDWVICFSAKDLKHAKKFESELLKTYKGIISETQLLELLFPIKKNGIQNPSVEKIKDFL